MLGQLEGYDSRENRLLKERLYKEMLDSQILMNRRYKKQQRQRDDRNYRQTSDREINHRVKKKGEMDDVMDESFIRRLRESRETTGYLYLPNLEDKNILYQGTSRYIPSYEPYRINPIKRIRTEIVQADQSSYEDPIIQGLIKQLQVINRCKVIPYPKRYKHLNYITRREKQPAYYSNNMSPESNTPISSHQTENEKQGKKAEMPNIFPSPLQRMGKLSRMSRNADSHLKSDKIDNQLQESKKLQNRQRLLSNRQSFLQVLRKVKDRGESLHIKFSKNLVQASKEQKNDNL